VSSPGVSVVGVGVVVGGGALCWAGAATGVVGVEAGGDVVVVVGGGDGDGVGAGVGFGVGLEGGDEAGASGDDGEPTVCEASDVADCGALRTTATWTTVRFAGAVR
jgi:hypothetical protein